mgnify:CR=1 FL=1
MGRADRRTPADPILLILGESHYRFVDGRVMEEWLVFDELAVLTQIERARLARPAGQSDQPSH